MGYPDHRQEEFRLIILRELEAQGDATLSETVLLQVASKWQFKKTRDMIKSDLRWLDSVGAIDVVEVEGYLIATLTERGLDHIEKKLPIDGIMIPSLKK